MIRIEALSGNLVVLLSFEYWVEISGLRLESFGFRA